MSERKDPRGNDRPNAPREPFSRRRFLQGVGTLSLAALAPKSLLSAGSLAATEKGARLGTRSWVRCSIPIIVRRTGASWARDLRKECRCSARTPAMP